MGGGVNVWKVSQSYLIDGTLHHSEDRDLQTFVTITITSSVPDPTRRRPPVEHPVDSCRRLRTVGHLIRDGDSGVTRYFLVGPHHLPRDPIPSPQSLRQDEDPT